MIARIDRSRGRRWLTLEGRSRGPRELRQWLRWVSLLDGAPTLALLDPSDRRMRRYAALAGFRPRRRIWTTAGHRLLAERP